MRDVLFETSKFATATFSTQVDLTFVAALTVGTQKQLTINGELSLHGQQQKLDAQIVLVKLAENKISISTTKPVLLNAKRFDLVAGVTKLQELAGLPSISNAVPVTFNLTFSYKAQ